MNKENPVNKLPKEQIKGIIIGKICNSKKIREKDSLIFTVEKIKVTRLTFPEALGNSCCEAVYERVKVSKIPELVREIALITKGDSTEKFKKF